MEPDRDNPFAPPPETAECDRQDRSNMSLPTVALAISAAACTSWFLLVPLAAEPLFPPYDEVIVVFAATISSPLGAVLGLVSCILYQGWKSWTALLLGIGSTLFLAFSILVFVTHSLGPILNVFITLGWLDIHDLPPGHPVDLDNVWNIASGAILRR